MLDVPPITPELLAELGVELGGLDFTHLNQVDFLKNKTACDVQAAPGNGKTTLIAAKLALLSRTWTSRRQGVCVISHTNAARTEVEDLITNHPTAARLKTYPHFVGTVTAFINQYLALPYLRGIGWTVRQIDDDAFAAEALRRYPSFYALENHAKRAQATVEKWVTDLDLDPEFDDDGATPESLKVRHRKGQHGADKECGKALAKLKAAMVKKGLYRYADMTALAWRAIRANPALGDRLRARFPLVILDEAQDTNGEQLKLLEHLFRRRDFAFQRLGDSNQTLYEDEHPTSPYYWTPGTGCIPLDISRRFGGKIATFASRLTVHKAQTIVGAGTKPGLRVLILFDEMTVGGVLGAFADEAREYWQDTCAARNIWAVASRHSVAAKNRRDWEPKSLVDYWPAYRHESGPRDKADAFCRQLQKAALHFVAAMPPVEVVEMLTAALAGFAQANGWEASPGRPIAAHNVWGKISQRDRGLPRRVRRLLYDVVLHGDAPWNGDAWRAFIEELQTLIGPVPQDPVANAVAEYCEFVSELTTNPSDSEHRSIKQAQFGNVTLQLGSIHSVKGKSVDGILVLESEVWKGNANDQKCIDLTTVLPQAFGITEQVFTGIGKTAATNVFVGVTRPRELLGLAMRESTAAAIAAAAKCKKWKVVDLVARAGEQRATD